MSDIMKELQELMKHSLKTTEEMKKDTIEMKRQMNSTTEQMKKDTLEMKKGIKDLEKLFRGMGLTQGSISEDIIAENFGRVFREIGEEINGIERNLKIYNKGREKGEFDIIAVNGSKVFIGETKTKLTKEHIDKLVNISIPNFKKYDNRHLGMKVYGVVGTRVFFNEEVKKYALEKGLYIIKEKHDGNAEILKESIKGVKSF